MQKVVSIYLTAWQRKHQSTDNLLSDELAQGWRVTSITTAGGASDTHGVGAWVIAVLEKPGD